MNYVGKFTVLGILAVTISGCFSPSPNQQKHDSPPPNPSPTPPDPNQPNPPSPTEPTTSEWFGFVGKCLTDVEIPPASDNYPFQFRYKIACSEVMSAATMGELDTKLSAWAKLNCADEVDVRGGTIGVGQEPCRIKNSADFRRSTSSSGAAALQNEEGTCVAKQGMAYGRADGSCPL